MQFLAEYSIKPNSAANIEVHKKDHLAFRMQLKPLRFVAQIHSEAREMIGSIVIIEAADSAEAERIARADPYVAEGIYDSVTITPCEVRFCDIKAP